MVKTRSEKGVYSHGQWGWTRTTSSRVIQTRINHPSQERARERCKIKNKKTRRISCASQNINPICISPLCSWFSCFLHLARLFCWCRGSEEKSRRNCRLMIINRPLVHEKQIKTSLWTLWKSNNSPETKPKLHHFAQEKRREEKKTFKNIDSVTLPKSNIKNRSDDRISCCEK